MAKREVSWDLSEMFASTTDPSIQKALDKVMKMANDFEAKYKTRLENLSARGLLKCFQDYEDCTARRAEITLFAFLSFAANMTLPDTQALYDKVRKANAEVDKKRAFFKIELGNLLKKNPEVINNRALANYKHFLEKMTRGLPHQVSEAEEKLIIEKDQYGVKAWEEMQQKWLNTRVFKVRVEGKMKTLSYGEAFGLLSHHDRATRKSAVKSIGAVLAKDGEIFVSALRNICNDWIGICERRKYESPMESSLIRDDLERQTVEDLLKTLEEHAPLYQRYFKLKAKLMRLPKLGYQDIAAPIPDAPKMQFAYDEAKDLIIEAYSRFDEEYARAAKDMFARKHVDALPRLGKQDGAFCSDWYKGKSAFVLVNFSETLHDAFTLAHELGHATHLYYFEEAQTFVNGSFEFLSMAAAETASVFGELLLTDLLLSQMRSKKEKKAILCTVLDNAAWSLLFSITGALFEQSLYDSIKQGKYLDYKSVCKCWTASRDKLYGDAVECLDEAVVRWAGISHFFMANFRFYNYPYAYAQLFVYALYQKYLEEGKAFVPKFKKALSAGGSISPFEIGKIMGLDINEPSFWKLGFKQFEHFVEELEKIVS